MKTRAERREMALAIWAEKIRLIPTDVHVEGALWDCIAECNEVSEELVEYINACKAFPGTKKELFFGGQ